MSVSLQQGFTSSAAGNNLSGVAIIPVEEREADFTTIDGRNLIEHAINEAQNAGISDIVLVCHSDLLPDVEQQRFGEKGGNIQFVAKDAKGEGMARLVHAARNCLEDDYDFIAYSNPQDLIVTDKDAPSALQQMIEHYNGNVVLGAMQPSNEVLFRGRALMPVDVMDTIRDLVRSETSNPDRDLYLKDVLETRSNDGHKQEMTTLMLEGQHFDFRDRDSVMPARTFYNLINAEGGNFTKAQDIIKEFFPTWQEKERGMDLPLSQITRDLSVA